MYVENGEKGPQESSFGISTSLDSGIFEENCLDVREFAMENTQLIMFTRFYPTILPLKSKILLFQATQGNGSCSELANQKENVGLKHTYFNFIYSDFIWKARMTQSFKASMRLNVFIYSWSLAQVTLCSWFCVSCYLVIDSLCMVLVPFTLYLVKSMDKLVESISKDPFHLNSTSIPDLRAFGHLYLFTLLS